MKISGEMGQNPETEEERNQHEISEEEMENICKGLASGNVRLTPMWNKFAESKKGNKFSEEQNNKIKEAIKEGKENRDTLVESIFLSSLNMIKIGAADTDSFKIVKLFCNIYEFEESEIEKALNEGEEDNTKNYEKFCKLIAEGKLITEGKLMPRGKDCMKSVENILEAYPHFDRELFKKAIEEGEKVENSAID